MSEENNNKELPNQPKPQPKRYIPMSELDLNLMITDSVWGKQEVAPELKERLEQYYIKKDKKGKPIYIDGQLVGDKQSLWGLLGFYTRDMRLANLNYWNGEVQYCQYFLDLANDLLQADMIKPFLISLSRVATLLELSQSKGGFLRKNMNTLRTENTNFDSEPPKKTLFGGQKKQQF